MTAPEHPRPAHTAALPPPVFVYGALRSGTTLFRLMLDAHEDILNPGEVDFLFDHLRRAPEAPTGWRYDRETLAQDRIFRAKSISLPAHLDGLDLLRDMLAQMARQGGGVLTLNVHRHAALIHETLPEARFIHILRDPRDVARSSIGMGWTGNSYYGVTHWIRTETEWQTAAIPSDQVLTVRFERLMAEIEPELSRVCAFLGLPFSPRMLDYHLNTSYGPPDPKIASSWKKKSSVHEVALIEGRAGALMDSLGYARNGAAHLPGSVERLGLFLQNRIMRWRFQVRRHGLPLFAATHLARVTGLKSWHRNLKRRQEANVIRNLK